MRSYAAAVVLAAVALLQGCGGALYATVKDGRGREVMLVGRALEGYSQPRIELPKD